MKKFLILCLVVIMLPVSALADAMRMDITLDMPQSGLDALLQYVGALVQEGYLDDLLGIQDAEADRQSVADAMVEVLDETYRTTWRMLDGANVHLLVDGTNADMSLSLNNQLIASMTFYSEKQAMTTDLMPGLLIALPLQQMVQESFSTSKEWKQLRELIEELTEDLQNLDLNLLATEANDILFQWADSLKAEEKSGSFAGETYTGGVYRRTVYMDERDLCLLADGLTHLPAMDAVREALEDTVEGVTELIGLSLDDEWDEELHRALLSAAIQNSYRYQMHLVYDEWDEIIGISIIALEGDEQVASLSMSEDSYVLGYGMESGNVYLTVQETKSDNDWNGSSLLSIQFIKDERRVGRYTASQSRDNILLSLTAGTTVEDAEAAFNISLDGALLGHTLWTLETRYSSAGQEKIVVRLLMEEEPIQTWTLTCESVQETVPALDERSLKYVDFLSGKAVKDREVQQAVEYAGKLLNVRLFRAMPAEMVIQNMGLDQWLDLLK